MKIQNKKYFVAAMTVLVLFIAFIGAGKMGVFAKEVTTEEYDERMRVGYVEYGKAINKVTGLMSIAISDSSAELDSGWQENIQESAKEMQQAVRWMNEMEAPEERRVQGRHASFLKIDTDMFVMKYSQELQNPTGGALNTLNSLDRAHDKYRELGNQILEDRGDNE